MSDRRSEGARKTAGSFSRFAVVGLGTRSSVVSLLSELRLPAQAVALCDPVVSRHARAIQRFPGARLFQSVDQLLESQIGLDGAFIMTTDDTHEELAVRFLDAGIAVFVEKPWLSRPLHVIEYLRQQFAPPPLSTLVTTCVTFPSSRPCAT